MIKCVNKLTFKEIDEIIDKEIDKMDNFDYIQYNFDKVIIGENDIDMSIDDLKSLLIFNEEIEIEITRDGDEFYYKKLSIEESDETIEDEVMIWDDNDRKTRGMNIEFRVDPRPKKYLQQRITAKKENGIVYVIENKIGKFIY